MLARILKVCFILLLLVTFGEGGFYLGTLYQLNNGQSTSQINTESAAPVNLERSFRPISTNPDELIYLDVKGASISARPAIRQNFLISIIRALEQPEGALKSAKIQYKLSGTVLNIETSPSDNIETNTLVYKVQEPKTLIVFKVRLTPPQQKDIKVFEYSVSGQGTTASSLEKVKVGNFIEYEEGLDLLTEITTIRTLTISTP